MLDERAISFEAEENRSYPLIIQLMKFSGE